jgi:hypothetical protein
MKKRRINNPTNRDRSSAIFKNETTLSSQHNTKYSGKSDTETEHTPTGNS